MLELDRRRVNSAQDCGGRSAIAAYREKLERTAEGVIAIRGQLGAQGRCYPPDASSRVDIANVSSSRSVTKSR